MVESVCIHCHKMIVPQYDLDTGEVRGWVHAMRVPRTNPFPGSGDRHYIEKFDRQCVLFATPEE